MQITERSKEDILACAGDLGIPEEQVTDEMIEQVKAKVSQGLGDWREVVRGMVKGAIKREDIKCSLGVVCSASCPWREVGGCIFP